MQAEKHRKPRTRLFGKILYSLGLINYLNFIGKIRESATFWLIQSESYLNSGCEERKKGGAEEEKGEFAHLSAAPKKVISSSSFNFNGRVLL